MPWIYSPFFLMVRKRNDQVWLPKNIEVVEAVGGHAENILENFLEEKRLLDATEPGYNYLFLRVVKGGEAGRWKHAGPPHPYEVELTKDGNLHFWCLPYHHECRVGKIEGDVPDSVLGDPTEQLAVAHAVDAVERYIQSKAEETVEKALQEKWNQRSSDFVSRVFSALHERR